MEYIVYAPVIVHGYREFCIEANSHVEALDLFHQYCKEGNEYDFHYDGELSRHEHYVRDEITVRKRNAT